MDHVITAIISAIAGFFVRVYWSLIQDSRSREKVRLALLTEIKTNHFIIRDARSYAREQTEALEKIKKIQTTNGTATTRGAVVVHDYKFRYDVFETNITELHELGKDRLLNIHHYYNRLRALERAAEEANRCFQGAKEFVPIDNDWVDVKRIDAKSLGSQYHRSISEYNLFEEQCYGQGEELINIMEKED